MRGNYGKKRSSSLIKTEKFDNIEEIEEKSESPICNRDKEMSSRMLIARQIDVTDEENQVAEQLEFLDEDLASPRKTLVTDESRAKMSKLSL